MKYVWKSQDQWQKDLDQGRLDLETVLMVLRRLRDVSDEAEEMFIRALMSVEASDVWQKGQGPGFGSFAKFLELQKGLCSVARYLQGKMALEEEGEHVSKIGISAAKQLVRIKSKRTREEVRVDMLNLSNNGGGRLSTRNAKSLVDAVIGKQRMGAGDREHRMAQDLDRALSEVKRLKAENKLLREKLGAAEIELKQFRKVTGTPGAKKQNRSRSST